MKLSLYNEFPRVIGYPVRVKILNSLKELNDYVTKNISKYDLHLSLYSFATVIRKNGILTPDYLSAKVNKVYFDLDEGNWIKQMKNLHNWCTIYNILHRMHLSSYKGGHFFIGCDHKLQFKKSALYNFQMYICKKFNIPVNKSISVFGDVARSFRIENTFNYKRQCYCVALTENELQKIQGISDPLLKKLTNKPQQEDTSGFWYGNKLINLSQFDEERYFFESERKVDVNIDSLLSNEELQKLNIPFDKFPKCIQLLLGKEDLGYYGRFLLTIYLRDQSFVTLTNKQILSVLKHSLNRETWIHCSTSQHLSGHNPGENLKPLKKILSGRYKMISCFKMNANGLCPNFDICGRWHPIYD